MRELIISLYWKRSNLYIVFKSDVQQAYIMNDKVKYELEICDKNKVLIPITNLDGNMLDKGIWKIEVDGVFATIDNKLLSEFDNYSRIFNYRKNFYSFLVEFDLNDNIFLIKTRYMEQNKKYKKFIKLYEADDLIGFLKIVLKIFSYKMVNLLYLILRMFKFGKKTVLFLSENSNQITSNLLPLYNALIDKKYKVIVYCHDNFKKRSVFYYLKELFMISKSDVILIENYTPILNFLNLKAKVIQLWHAGVGFKAVGYARFGKKGSPHPYLSSHRKNDFVIVDSERLIDVYAEVFGVSKSKIKPYGMPRLDNYLNKQRIDNVLERLYEYNHLLKNKKVILFAPTYRGSNQKEAYYNFDMLNIDEIYKFCLKNNFVFLIKMHPFVKNKINIKKEYHEYIFDYSDLDINDIIYVSDILITDYSSCVYEFSMFDRPIIFYRYDKYLYEYERPLHELKGLYSNTYEVLDFDNLLMCLNNLKDIDVNLRFKNCLCHGKDDSVEKIVYLIDKEI